MLIMIMLLATGPLGVWRYRAPRIGGLDMYVCIYIYIYMHTYYTNNANNDNNNDNAMLSGGPGLGLRPLGAGRAASWEPMT